MSPTRTLDIFRFPRYMPVIGCNYDMVRAGLLQDNGIGDTLDMWLVPLPGLVSTENHGCSWLSIP